VPRSFLVSLLQVALAVGDILDTPADRDWESARELARQGRHLEAAGIYRRLAETERDIWQKIGTLRLCGDQFKRAARYPEALQCLEPAQAIARAAHKDRAYAGVSIELGEVHERLGEYDRARSLYDRALSVAEQSPQSEDLIGDARLSLARLHAGWGEYEQALAQYSKALSLQGAVFTPRGRARALFEKGALHRSLGQLTQAVESLSASLALSQDLKDGGQYSQALEVLGDTLLDEGQSEQALASYRGALRFYDSLVDVRSYARCLTSIGTVYAIRKESGSALRAYRSALAIRRQLADRSGAATILWNMGSVYESAGESANAARSYRLSQTTYRSIGDWPHVAAVGRNLGELFIAQQRHVEAIAALTNSVEVTERLRLQATGGVRRDYLDSQIRTYQLLAWAYLQNKDLSGAYRVTELSHAKFLAEQLAGRSAWTAVEPPDVQKVQEMLTTDAAVLIYANVGSGYDLALVFTREGLFAQPLARQPSGASRSEISGADDEAPVGPRGLSAMVRYYLSLLKEPVQTSAGEREDLARTLYSHLVKPVSPYLQGKTRLLVIPEGILNVLPFEALMDPAGRYLVEQFHVTYCPSLRVWQLLAERRYEDVRQPLLAFGGAVYDRAEPLAQRSPKTEAEPEILLNRLRGRIFEAEAEKRGFREIYERAGLANWRDLPGTLAEIRAIAKIVPHTDLLTGSNVSEHRIKALSREGRLARYRVLHFATHGFAVSSPPEMSALVLSDAASRLGDEDGYLRAYEVARLKLRADFVNLSSCETGLGRLYRGEGVVGLTQAFLLAGANGVMVSLWQVDDMETASFMTELYQKTERDGLDFGEALTSVKRERLRGSAGRGTTAPIDWASFVYIGRSSLRPMPPEGRMSSVIVAGSALLLAVLAVILAVFLAARHGSRRSNS